MLICLMAAPSVRSIVGPEYVEGVWMEIREEQATALEIAGAAPYNQMFGTAEDADAELVLTPGEALVARPSGRMARRESDLMSAPVWEIRRRKEWD